MNSMFIKMNVQQFFAAMSVMLLIICINYMVTVRHFLYNRLPKLVPLRPWEYDAHNSINVCGRVDLSLPLCPQRPLKSDKFKVNLEPLSFDEIARLHGNDLSDGGHFRPSSCRSDQKVAIVIPYRDRDTNLKQLLNNLIPFLKRQNVDFHLFVVEQIPGSKFNRGMVKNIGFMEARKICDFDCVLFHDIDMTPVDNGNIYKCGYRPRQHSRNLTRWGNEEPEILSFGGVVSMRPEQFQKANGYPNCYFEWGAEDDELGLRIEHKGMKKTGYPFEIGGYEEFAHKRDKEFILRYEYFVNWEKRANTDGLNSLNYTLKAVVHKQLFTHIFVDIDIETVRKAYHGHILDEEGEGTKQNQTIRQPDPFRLRIAV